MSTQTNEQLYNNIIKIYPNFSLYALYLKYKEYDTYARRFQLDDAGRKIYEAIKDLHFEASCFLFSDDIEIKINVDDLDAWKMAIPEGNYGGLNGDEWLSVHPKSECYHDVRHAMYQIILDHSSPSVVKPYIGGRSISFSYMPQPEGDGLPYNEKYTEYIKKIDPNFTMQTLHDNLVKQCEVAHKLTEHPSIMRSLYLVEKDICNIDYYPGLKRLEVTNVKGEVLFEIEDGAEPELCISIIANLYDGTNTSFFDFKNGENIAIDTHPESFGF